MAREYVWHTSINGVRNGTDHTFSLYNGPGTVWRVIGTIGGASTATPADPAANWAWVVNVGSAAADPLGPTLDPPGTLLRGGVTALVAANARVYTQPPPAVLESEGRRVIGAGEQVWCRLRAQSGGTLWFWTWSIRVLVLLPEA